MAGFVWRNTSELAQQALNKAIETERTLSMLATTLDSHIKYCTSAAMENRRREDEWRTGLGQRLDQQDRRAASQTRIMLAIAGGVVMVLLTTIGFLVAHLPLFVALH